MSQKPRMTSDLYALIVEAEKTARRAHDRSYEVGVSSWTCMALGRAQSILMHYVAKYAHLRTHQPPESTPGGSMNSQPPFAGWTKDVAPPDPASRPPGLPTRP